MYKCSIIQQKRRRKEGEFLDFILILISQKGEKHNNKITLGDLTSNENLIWKGDYITYKNDDKR